MKAGTKSADTLKHHEVTRKKVETFIRWRYKVADKPLKEVSFSLAPDFEHYLTTVDGISSNTVMKHVKVLKQVLKMAVLTEVRVNGINRSNDELGIPESVQHYWDYENKEVMRSIYFKDIVNEFLNKDYVEKYEYLLIKYDSAMKKKDSLSYAYFQLQDSKRN